MKILSNFKLLLTDFKALKKTNVTWLFMLTIPLYFVFMGLVGVYIANPNLVEDFNRVLVGIGFTVFFSLCFGIFMAIWYVVKTSAIK